MLKKIISASLVCLFLAACGESGSRKGDGVGKYGMMPDNTPEYTTVKFFESLYNEKDIATVMSYSSPRMSRLVESYRTSNNIQRHVVNLKYDEVKIELDSGDTRGRTEFADAAMVTVFFSGTYGEDKVEDLRTVELVRLNNKWKVDKIKESRYR
jgi:hypothetical protein